MTHDRRVGERRRYIRRASDRLAAELEQQENPIYKGNYFKERRRRDRRVRDRRRGLSGEG
ncbi:MAG: hypothetical protein D6739_11835 [Nitrospirae bacterium]|nr:MAG: hypothetical protein D6739_11835 [Nitrospirota bacterium]